MQHLKKIVFVFFLLTACDSNYVEHNIANKESVAESDFADAQTVRKQIRSFKAQDFIVSHHEIGISDYEGLSEILIQKNGKTLDSLIAPSGFLEIVVATEFNEDIFLKDLDGDGLPNLLLKQYTGEKACCYDLININLTDKELKKETISGRYSEILVHNFNEKSFILHLKDGDYIDLKAMPSVYMKVEGKKNTVDMELMKTQFVAQEKLEKASKEFFVQKKLAYDQVLSWIYSGKGDQAYQIVKQIWKNQETDFEKLWAELKNRTVSGVYSQQIKQLNKW